MLRRPLLRTSSAQRLKQNGVSSKPELNQGCPSASVSPGSGGRNVSHPVQAARTSAGKHQKGGGLKTLDHIDSSPRHTPSHSRQLDDRELNTTSVYATLAFIAMFALLIFIVSYIARTYWNARWGKNVVVFRHMWHYNRRSNWSHCANPVLSQAQGL